MIRRTTLQRHLESSEEPRAESSTASPRRVFAVVDLRRGDAVQVFVHRKDAARFLERVREDDPKLAARLRIEERSN
jgi:hypothetical protein